MSDKIRRKEYDMKLTIAMQEEVGVEYDGSSSVALDTFWTACTTCRLLHQFERKYLGHNLMCPNCRKSFKAAEIDDGKSEHVDGNRSETVRTRMDSKRKMSSVGEIMKRSEKLEKIDESKIEGGSKRSGGCRVRKSVRLKDKGKIIHDVDEDMMTLSEMQKLVNNDNDEDDEEMMTLAQMQKLVNNDDDDDYEEETMTLAQMQKLVNNDDDYDEETMTLAQMQKLVNNDDDDDYDEETVTLAQMQKLVNNNDDDDYEEETMTLAQMQKLVNKDDDDDYEEETMTLAEMQKLVKTNVNDGKLKVRLKVNGKDKKLQRSRKSKNEMDEEGDDQDVDIMTVEDSDFYDFDKLRIERSFKKGQIWAAYDDYDGMPRNYGLINEVVSTHPFEVDMSWLDPQINTDEELISLERTGFHISCGRFKVANKTLVGSLNIFSHIVNCERAAREVYRIFPKKGSVWALYSENGERGNQLARDKRYDIVVFLTSYSEVHGLSMGYLEKVNGFKTIFRRREIGCHAVIWLEKHEVRLFSHQIPARKLSGEEVPDVSGDCWELDPASLPKQLLITG